MTTVKEFKDLGVEFVVDDLFEAVEDNSPTTVTRRVAEIFNDGQFPNVVILSFAWRPFSALPANPKFMYEECMNGVLWRPLLDQPKKSVYDVDAHVSGEKVKSVFTQAMADEVGVGSKVVVKAVNGVKDGVVIGVFERWYWVDVAGLGLETYDKALVSKLDTRTPKQKAVDEMIKSLETFENEFVQLNEYEAGKLYDLGYRKC